MQLLLYKLLPVFIYPLGLAIVLVALGGLLALWRNRRLATALIVVALVLLWGASTPLVASLLTGRLEDQYPPVAAASVAPADVAVVLGGGLVQSGGGLPSFGPGGDRLIQGLLLWRAGKVRKILVTGGNLPWEGRPRPEADVAADVLVALGVPRDALIIESGSRTTRENAENVLPIWHAQGFHTGFLVTSAWHMPRALATFRQVGLDLVPFPADFREPDDDGGGGLSIFAFLPEAHALAATTDAVKEWIGLTIYRLRGWA